MSTTDDNPDRVHIGGKTFERTTETNTTPEEMDEINAAFAAFEQRRKEIPEDQKFHLSDRYGGYDFEGTEYEDYVNEQRRKRHEGGQD
ncbi:MULTISPECIES: hypothetical protein [Nocardia]|uniref:Uncharacterized protein n=2 Tax=Nocardia TaxID=1817 RepID=A0A2T2YU64_9NOCA|nr:MULTISPECIES: hypothetical protein [Nocardia]MBF6446058.1 hypothetical protein [Nocardia elegans]PSR59062.1 hypothetical protein C8259_28395 [Nocardia nova]